MAGYHFLLLLSYASKQKHTNIRVYLIVAVSVQNQATFAKCVITIFICLGSKRETGMY